MSKMKVINVFLMATACAVSCAPKVQTPSSDKLRKEMLDFQTIVNVEAQTTLESPYVGALAIAYVDGDGKNELIVGAYTPEWFALFDKTKLTGKEEVGIYVYKYDNGRYQLIASIVVGDINGDGGNEIVVSWRGGARDGDIVIYQPKPTDIFNEVFCVNVDSIRTSRGVSIGDVDNDGMNELLIGATWWGRYMAIYKYDKNLSDYMEVWRDELHSDFHSTVVADADNDGTAEIVAGTAEWGTYDVRVYEYVPKDGIYELSWSHRLGGVQEAVVGDVNNDGKNEILVTSSYEEHMQRAGDYGAANIFGYDGKDYKHLWTCNHYSCEKPVIGDALNSGNNQFAFIGGEHLHLYEYNGIDYVELWKTPIKEALPYVGDVPGQSGETKMLNDVAIGDVNNDGKNELVFSSFSEGVYIYSLKGIPAGVAKE